MKKKILLTLILAIFTFNILGVNIMVIATDEEINTWDVSENGDGSVIATLEDSGKLIIDGNGAMKDFTGSTIPYYKVRGNITKVEIRQGVTTIGDYAFYDCNKMLDIDIPNSIISIGERALYWCSELTEIDIPSSVTDIGEKAFYGCSKIEEITIPARVVNIEAGVLANCYKLKKINVASNSNNYMSENGILFNKEKTELVCYPGGIETTTYTIPKEVISIGNYAFYDCDGLKEINIPNNVKNIGEYAFYDCNRLKEIDIPSSITSIEKYAFYDCENIEKIDIKSSIANIGDRAFGYNYSLKHLYIPDDFRGEIKEGAFDETMITMLTTTDNSDEDLLITCEYGNEELVKIFKNVNNVKSPLYSTSLNQEKYESLNDGKKLWITLTSIENGALKGMCLRAVPYGAITYNLVSNGYTSTSWYNRYNKIIKNSLRRIINFIQNKIDLSNLEYTYIPMDFLTNVEYIRNEWFNFDMEAVLHIEDGEKIINNNGNEKYVFRENGEFTYKYLTKEGKEKTATAKVTNIDQEAPKVMNVIKDIDESGNTIIKVNAEDRGSGINAYGFCYEDDIGEIFVYELLSGLGIHKTEKNTVATQDGKKRMAIIVEDKANNAVLRNIDTEFEAIIGDTNEDGEIDFKDMLKINKYRLNKLEFNEKELTSADTNFDNKVDFKDILQINKFRLGTLIGFFDRQQEALEELQDMT